MCLNWNNKNRTYVTSVSERHSTIELYSSINGVEWTRTTTPHETITQRLAIPHMPFYKGFI